MRLGIMDSLFTQQIIMCGTHHMTQYELCVLVIKE